MFECSRAVLQAVRYASDGEILTVDANPSLTTAPSSMTRKHAYDDNAMQSYESPSKSRSLGRDHNSHPLYPCRSKATTRVANGGSHVKSGCQDIHCLSLSLSPSSW